LFVDLSTKAGSMPSTVRTGKVSNLVIAALFIWRIPGMFWIANLVVTVKFLTPSI